MRNDDDDILIMAYVDGELSATEARHVEERLEREPGLQKMADEFRFSRDFLADAFAFEPATKVPERLQATITEAAFGTEAPIQADQNSTAQPNNVIRLSDVFRKPALRPARTVAALAASVALVVGISIGTFPWLDQATDQPSVTAKMGGVTYAFSATQVDPALSQLLNSMPSGEAIRVPETDPTTTRDFIVLSTFKDQTNRYCREYAEKIETVDTTASLSAIACRSDTGGWTIATAHLTPSIKESDGYVTASGDGPSTTIDLKAPIGGGDALNTDIEQRLLEEWAKP